jgi:hypothetical protein
MSTLFVNNIICSDTGTFNKIKSMSAEEDETIEKILVWDSSSGYIKYRNGITGPTGSTGLHGNNGEIGPTGAQGVQGFQGVQGIKGDSGSTGIQGIKGDTGSQGIQGATGLQGQQGTIGATGQIGSIGQTGATGLQGSTGLQGIQGNTGATGRTGSTGSQGIQGSTGATGTPGIQGNVGPTGAQFPVIYCSANNAQTIASNIITSWTELLDSSNAFNPSTGVFTTPSTGQYIIYAQIPLSSALIGANVSPSLNILVNNTASSSSTVSLALSLLNVIKQTMIVSYFGTLSANDTVTISLTNATNLSLVTNNAAGCQLYIARYN